MGPSDSVSTWIEQLQTGEREAAHKLWGRYFSRMVALARARLRGRPRRMADEEDVALSAFDTFCRRAEEGRFPDLHDRDDLWRLLFTLTERKAVNLARHEGRLRRGGGGTVGEADLTGSDDSGRGGLDAFAGREPTPEFIAALTEEFEARLGSLGDDELRAIVLAKMEGLTTDEIVARTGWSPRTVARKLELIRILWSREDEP
jgi:DNA-directed RNA polymerase specialized sigma24 family protein